MTASSWTCTSMHRRSLRRPAIIRRLHSTHRRARGRLRRKTVRGTTGALFLLSLAALTRCVSVPPNEAVSAAAAQVPTDWRNAPTGVETITVPAWWDGFADAQLRALIDKALAHNYDLKAAAERAR